MITADLLFVFISCAAIIATRPLTDGIVCGASEIDADCRTGEESFARSNRDAKSDHIERTLEPKMSSKLFICDFEVFGIVQGVFFRKFTQKQASSLGLRGWCMNTHDGTVKGQLEGEEKPMNEMKHWLQTKGSPSSRIDKAVFSVPKEITSYSFKDFSVHR
ncbi:acylphosphatase-2-like [Anopheles merus]|nr:acylphosphatase-2-like [Anopheles merus]